MASFLGAFARYQENAEHMLRVMRNHRAAAYDAEDAYEGLSINPTGINAKYCPANLLKAATKAWDDAVQLGEKYGYRNAQTTVIAPTGTIGLVMDCDTTGVEPDFALVKFKKLSGGGYFKIINGAVPSALKNLGYTTKEIEAIEKYAVGAASFEGAPFINSQTLSAKGFTEEEIAIINNSAKSAFNIAFIFNRFTLGENCLQRLGFTEVQYSSSDFILLEALGFTEEEIDAANDYVCGTMTVEGAPYLKEEHLPVFDCANKCGKKGVRYIHAHGHIRMMSACQPFLSGAISKTINLPHEATIEEIADCYKLSWELGLKANALYRDGSKLSQPLSTKSDKKKKTTDQQEATEEANESTIDNNAVLTDSNIVDLSKLSVDDLLDEVNRRMAASTDTTLKRQLSQIVERKSLPTKRSGYTHKAKINGQVIFVRTGEYSDGTLGEIFIDLSKEGSTVRSLMNCFAIAVSVGLQFGVPLEEFVEKFVFTRFEPAGMVEHPNIKTTTSLVDFVFRLLAYEYLGKTDLVHVLNAPSIGNTGDDDDYTDQNQLSNIHITAPTNQHVSSPNTTSSAKPQKLQRLTPVKAESSLEAINFAAKSMQSDAPACNVCGNITIRSGTCYKCLNCGNSLGCS
jgi:ribonucleoside-diphosphate reductase alpha chain